MNMPMNNTDVSESIQSILESKIKQGDLEIWGGKIDEQELRDFLNAWDFNQMPYSITETINTIMFEMNFNFQNLQESLLNSIQRVRIFGIKGDLNIRKDGSSIFWRFIGDEKPPENYNQNNFWINHPNQEFFTTDEEAFLWGTYNPESHRWRSNKVGKADLNYPVQEFSRVKLNFKTFSHNAQIAFVRLIDVKEVIIK